MEQQDDMERNMERMKRRRLDPVAAAEAVARLARTRAELRTPKPFGPLDAANAVAKLAAARAQLRKVQKL